MNGASDLRAWRAARLRRHTDHTDVQQELCVRFVTPQEGAWAHSMASLTVMPPLPEPECSRSYLISSSDTLLLSAEAWRAPRRPATQRQCMPGRELHTWAATLAACIAVEAA